MGSWIYLQFDGQKLAAKLAAKWAAKWTISFAIAAITLFAWSFTAQPSQAATCDFFSEPQRYNTQTRGEVIVIGAQRDRPYRVVIISESRDTLAAIQACILDAFIADDRFGAYIQVGSFNNRSDAETLRLILQKEGFSARVIYGF